MASSYTTSLGIEEMGSGDQSGAWGTTTNYNWDIIDRIAAYSAVPISGTTHTLTVRAASPSSGSSNVQDGMYRVIKFTGALGANNTVTIAPNTTAAYFVFINATTDSGGSGPYSVILSQGSGANITVPNGSSAVVYCDGAGSGAAVVDALANLYVSDSITIGDASTEDTKIVFDGAAQDFYIGLDDSADDLVIGSGSVVGTTPAMSIDENQAVVFPAAAVTIGDASEEDTKLVYDGNAKDFYIGLDDSEDKLIIGEGSTVGTNNIISITDDALTIGDGAEVDTKIVFDGNAKDFYVGLDDSADKLVVGVDSTVGTNSILTLTDDTVTIGDGAAVDTYLNFDGNAVDFRIGIDDGTDKLEIGAEVAHGTTAAIAIDANADMLLGGYLNFQDEQAIRPEIKDYAETINALGDTGGGTDAIDVSAGNVVTATVSTGTQDFTFTNPSGTGKACSFTLHLTNGGSQTVNWPNSVDWAGGSAPSLTSSGLDVLTFTTIDAGTTWLGFVAGADVKSPS